MTSTLLIAVALIAAPEAQSPQNLDWLVGRWRQPPSASPQWLELTWTPTAVGFRGAVERVRNDGTRASEETYEIEIRDPLKLTWRHAPDAGRPPVQDVFQGSAGPGSHVEFFWASRAPVRTKRTRDDPYTVQFTVADGRLQLMTARRRHIKSAWSTVEFERAAAGPPRPPSGR